MFSQLFLYIPSLPRYTRIFEAVAPPGQALRENREPLMLLTDSQGLTLPPVNLRSRRDTKSVRNI